MGRINLTALRVRKRALAELASNRITSPPSWLDVIGDVPPAQILTRQQPQQHVMTQVRTQTLPGGKTAQVTLASSRRKPNKAKPSRLFAPVEIKYEEDDLRKQFFQDHPWELARPRMVLETTGDQHKSSDYSRGLKQSAVPLSGESVIQRQMHLLHTVPDMTTEQAYDVARREFYMLRRSQEITRRIAKEEAEHMGAQPERGVLEWGMEVENKHYNNWEEWSREQVMEQQARNAAFSGEAAPSAEQQILGGGAAPQQSGPTGAFAVQAQRNQGIRTGTI